MILKSMGVECKKDDMDTYSADVDEEGSGKFSFMMFCAVCINCKSITVFQMHLKDLLCHLLSHSLSSFFTF